MRTAHERSNQKGFTLDATQTTDGLHGALVWKMCKALPVCRPPRGACTVASSEMFDGNVC